MLDIMRDHLPLTRIDAARLAAEGPLGDGTFGSIDPDEIPYGTTMHELISTSWNLNDLLEGAAVAGRLGFCDTGILIAIRAAHLIAVAEATELVSRGVDGDALGALDATLFRQISALAERVAADLEERAAKMRAAQ